MKIRTTLGALKASDFKHPTVCFRLSKAMSRVSEALTFGESYLKGSKGALSPKDLHVISTSFFSSGKQAKELALLVDGKDLKQAVEAYSKSAVRANNSVRALKAPSVKDMKGRMGTLRKNLSSIEKKVESLCTIEKPSSMSGRPSPAPVSPVRVTMAGSFKKPIYPRYFVASMGRSRR